MAAVQAKALYTKAEEQLLATISSVRNSFVYLLNRFLLKTFYVLPIKTSQPTLEIFEKLLQENATVFHAARTAQALQAHWQLMKQYHLLPDQSGTLIKSGSFIRHKKPS